MPRPPVLPVDAESRRAQFLWFVSQVPVADQALMEYVDHGGPRDLPVELQEHH